VSSAAQYTSTRRIRIAGTYPGPDHTGAATAARIDNDLRMTNVPTPSEADCAGLNEQFFGVQPWIYFQQRLAHLMLVASGSEQYRAILAKGVSAHGVSLALTVDPDTSELPTPEQSFTAVEAEVLLHQSAETLLRFVHALAEPSPCPWMRMAVTRHDFKPWVRTAIAEADYDHVVDLCREVFACDPANAADLDAFVCYLRLLANHFLDADPYNAAKHGMALRGASERLSVDLDGRRLLERDGMVISWLTRWRTNAERPARWTQASRLLDEAATIALIYTTTMLMRSLWIRGRERYLGEPSSEVFRPVSPDRLFSSRRIHHHVLADVYRSFASDDEQESIVIRSAHFEPRTGESPL